MATASPNPSASQLIDQLKSKKVETVEEFKEAIKSSTEEGLTALQAELNSNRELALSDQERINLTAAIESLEKERAVDQSLAGLEGRLNRIRQIFAVKPAATPTTSQGTTPPATPQQQSVLQAKQEKILKSSNLGEKINSIVVKPVSKILGALGGKFGVTPESIQSVFWGLVQTGKLPFLNIPILGQKLKEEADARIALSKKKALLTASIEQVKIGKPIIFDDKGSESLVTISDQELSVSRIREIVAAKQADHPDQKQIIVTIADIKEFKQRQAREQELAKAEAQQKEQKQQEEKKVSILKAFDLKENEATITKGSPVSMERGTPIKLTLSDIKTPEADGADKTLLLVSKVLTNAQTITVGKEDQPVIENATTGLSVSIPSIFPAKTAGLLNNVCAKVKEYADIKKVSYKDRVPSANAGVKFEGATGEIVLSLGDETLQTIATNGFPPQVKEVTESTYFQFTGGSWKQKTT